MFNFTLVERCACLNCFIFQSVSTAFFLPQNKLAYQKLALKHRLFLPHTLSFYLYELQHPFLAFPLSIPSRIRHWILSSTSSPLMSGCQMEEKHTHPFIVASFNTQSVKGSDMGCKRCEISTYNKSSSIDLFL